MPKRQKSSSSLGRKTKVAKKSKARRQQESPETRERRLHQNRTSTSSARQQESPDTRDRRLQQDREATAAARRRAKRKHSALPHLSTPATTVNNKRTVATFSSVDGPASSNSTEKTRPPSQRGPLTLLTINSEPEDEEHSAQDATELEVKFEPGEDRATGSSCDGERPPMPLVKIEADWEDEVAPPSMPRGTAPLVPQVKVEAEEEEEVTDASSAEEKAPDRTDNDPVPQCFSTKFCHNLPLAS